MTQPTDTYEINHVSTRIEAYKLPNVLNILQEKEYPTCIGTWINSAVMFVVRSLRNQEAHAKGALNIASALDFTSQKF